MQRIITFGLLALLAGGGGWTFLRDSAPEGVRRAVETARTVGGAVLAQQGTTPPPQQPAPVYSQPATYGTPPGAAVPTGPRFAPAPQRTTAPTIRIASFNIQTFGNKKASKSYVMDALARVVRQFDVIAIQEIRTQDDYFIRKFLDGYVNQQGVVYDAKVSPRLGRTSSTEQYAFIYNTQTVEVHPSYCSVFPDPKDTLHREPYVAFFRTRVVAPYQPFTFTLINAHTDPDEIPKELDALYHVFSAVQRTRIDGAAEDDIILLGDLNTKVNAASPRRPDSRARSLRPSDLGMLARIPGISPLIRDRATMVSSNRLYDNLLVPSYSTIEFTGRYGVVDLQTELGYQLTEKQAREVSDHLPVWGEFSAIEGGTYRSAQR